MLTATASRFPRAPATLIGAVLIAGWISSGAGARSQSSSPKFGRVQLVAGECIMLELVLPTADSLIARVPQPKCGAVRIIMTGSPERMSLPPGYHQPERVFRIPVALENVGAQTLGSTLGIAAAAQWPVEGVPDNPRGWLYRVTVRRLADQARSELARRRREDAVASEVWAEWVFVPPAGADVPVEEDDSLVLLFMCCHPALTPSSAIALTLRAVGGLTTAEIANAFMVPEATMAQRISRAKQTIKSSAVPFAMPSDDERDDRLRSVLHVLYLIFNEGYTSSIGPVLQRTDLSTEAIRLTRDLHAQLPENAEVTGLLALMLLTDARRAARVGENGELIPLDEQERSRWDQELIREGIALVSAALPSGIVGPYQLQAAIAAVHDEAPTAAETDWPQILALYRSLEQLADNPMVTLNRAIATAMVHGPAAGLALVDALEADVRIAGHYRLHAVRAHLLERAGDREGAIANFRAAARGTTSIPERDYLETKGARLAAGVESRPTDYAAVTRRASSGLSQ
jgi:predicted RNA polymerase sigma factor